MEIRGGKNQVGNSNRQFIESTVITTNNHSTFNISINVNCTECRQHQHLEGVVSSQGNVHHVIDCLQKIAASGDQPCDPPAAEADIKCQIEPATQSQEQVVKKKKRKVTGFSRQSSSPEQLEESVRILDSRGQVLEPGDAIWANDLSICFYQGSSIYVGDGYVVRYDMDSETVVKEKLDMTRPFYKVMALRFRNLNEFPPEQRVQRALQQVGKPCPVPGGSGEDFVWWIYTGPNFLESILAGSIAMHIPNGVTGFLPVFILVPVIVSIGNSYYGFKNNDNQGKRQGR